MTVLETLVFSGATLAMSGMIAWWVLRPFDRARRERDAQKHAAE